MSRELEALRIIEDFISEMPLQYKGYNNLGASEYISDKLNEVEDTLIQFEKLTKAVKEYFRLSSGVIGSDTALRLIELEKTIKELLT